MAAVGDLLDEADETFFIRFASADANATVPPALAAPNGATATIKDNDADRKPTVGIYDAEVEEPQNDDDTVLRFPVNLSAPSGRDVTVTVTATDGTAKVVDNDYETPAGTLVIPAEGMGGYVDVPINGDGADSASAETFTVTLSNPQNAMLDPDHTAATGTIHDEDGLPTLRITGTTVSEGVVGGKATVTVDLFPVGYFGGHGQLRHRRRHGECARRLHRHPSTAVSFGPGQPIEDLRRLGRSRCSRRTRRRAQREPVR